MGRGIEIDGGKMESLRRQTALSQEAFGYAFGMSSMGVYRLTRPGTHSMHGNGLARLAAFIGCRPDDLRSRLAPDGQSTVARPAGRRVPLPTPTAFRRTVRMFR